MHSRAKVTPAQFATAAAVPVAAAGIAGAILLFASFAPSGRSAAAAPLVVPGCASQASGVQLLPSAVPVRDTAAGQAPAVTAKAAAVIDAETGRVLYGLNEHQRRSPASTTKIMTAILALETVDEESWTVSEIDATKMPGSSVMGLRPGVYIKIRDLLYGLMLPSGNDAALAIAENIDGTVRGFVERMNNKADELGLEDTHFRNPHGLDARDHYSSAYDLSMLGRYGMANESFRRIAGTSFYHLGPPSDYDLSNGNSLLNSYAGADGVKIGWTNRAGWTFVASAVRDGRRVIVTVLDSEDRDADAAALLDWAFAAHEWRPLGPRATSTLRLMRAFGVGTTLVDRLGVCA